MRFLCPTETADFWLALTKVRIIIIHSATTNKMEAIYYIKALSIAKGTCIRYQGQFHCFKKLKEMQYLEMPSPSDNCRIHQGILVAFTHGRAQHLVFN